MTWKSATEAPRNGHVHLFCTKDHSELMFARWQYNHWTGDQRFTSLDDGDFSIPTDDLADWLFIEGIPVP